MEGEATMQKFILDVDTGVDDALAVLYAIGEEQSDLIGITTTYGNIDVKKATQNTLDILNLVERTDIPVYEGSSHSLAGEGYIRREVTARIHGENGIGDIQIEPSERMPEEQDAIDFIIESAHQYGKDLKIVAVGPLTNLARVYQKDPAALAQVEEIVIMGGALTVPGNASKFAEANILEDAEAAKIILESGLPLKLVGLDVTMRTILTQQATNEWLTYGTEKSQAIAHMTQHYFESYKNRLGMLGCALHDPLAVGIALHLDLAETLALNLTVETEGPARGLTIGDYSKLTDESPSTKVCIQVDDVRFLAYFMNALEKILS